MKKVISIVGARPNFMKIAPIHKAFQPYSDKVQHLICHTGQHFDEKMSEVFFTQLELPKPHFFLGIGGGSHAEQTAKIMMEFEKIAIAEKPDLVIVVGDVNSTMACTLVTSKLGIKTAHVEAGLRSFDRQMPEEINRLVTDVLADYLFTTEAKAHNNLLREGVSDEKIFFCGNVMIDSLVQFLPKIEQSSITSQLGIEAGKFILCTFHRPSNVDTQESLTNLVDLLNTLGKERKVVFPIHPRTSNNLKKFGLDTNLSPNLILTDPIGYIDFLNLTKNAELIVTDSGGVQEESTWLGVQCITVRDNTERPITVDVGTNQLIGTDLSKVKIAALEVLNGFKKQGSIPELWDGKAASRITEIIVNQIL
jgi:UDP-N-acetylglucosamine 2-epimerase (non-hydrolysing)